MNVYFHKTQTLFKHIDWLKVSLIPYSREATNLTSWQSQRDWAESDVHNSWNVGENRLAQPHGGLIPILRYQSRTRQWLQNAHWRKVK